MKSDYGKHATSSVGICFKCLELGSTCPKCKQKEEQHDDIRDGLSGKAV